MKQMHLIDKVISNVDIALRTVLIKNQRITNRANPAADIPECDLSAQEKTHVAGLMRVNHAGEVAAQALYLGQGITANLDSVKEQMKDAANEENDHLAWCESRLNELDSRTSYLDPLWFTGSLTIGMIAGILGDQYSLGFVAETEKQVSEHLQKHINKLPKQDLKTKVILDQMYKDELQHQELAMASGAMELPQPIKSLMGFVSKVMTKSAYWV